MAALQQLFDVGQHGSRIGNRTQILGVCRAVHDTGHQSFEVKHVGKKLGKLLTQHKAVVKLLNRALSSMDRSYREQGMLYPAAQKTRTGRGPCLIQHPKQGALLLFCAHGFAKLQVAARVGIHLQVLSVRVYLQVL